MSDDDSKFARAMVSALMQTMSTSLREQYTKAVPSYEQNAVLNETLAEKATKIAEGSAVNDEGLVALLQKVSAQASTQANAWREHSVRQGAIVDSFEQIAEHMVQRLGKTE